MIANFGSKPISSIGRQRVATKSPNPSATTKSSINHTQISGIETDKKRTHKKHKLNARDMALINQYLADLQNSQINEEDKLISVDQINHSIFESKRHLCIRNMLRRNNNMWNGRPDDLKVA